MYHTSVALSYNKGGTFIRDIHIEGVGLLLTSDFMHPSKEMRVSPERLESTLVYLGVRYTSLPCEQPLPRVECYVILRELSHPAGITNGILYHTTIPLYGLFIQFKYIIMFNPSVKKKISNWKIKCSTWKQNIQLFYTWGNQICTVRNMVVVNSTSISRYSEIIITLPPQKTQYLHIR